MTDTRTLLERFDEREDSDGMNPVAAIAAASGILLLVAGLLALVGWFLVETVTNEWAYLAPALGLIVIALVVVAAKRLNGPS